MEPRISRTERVYRHLVRDILGGRWEPGDTLSTYALAEELDVSRTPILQALQRLEREGFVEIIPQVGTRIVAPATGPLEELFKLRTALDGLAAEAAARRIEARELSELEALGQQLEEAAKRGDPSAYDELNARFHLLVAEASGMAHVVQAARTAWSALRYQLARLPGASEEHHAAAPEHREIVEALRRGSPKRARAAAERHAAFSTVPLVARHRQGHAKGLAHGAAVYASDEDYLGTALPFVKAGLSADERVLAVTTPHNIEVLGEALGARAESVEFRESGEWYHVPSHTLLAYERYAEHAGRDRVRVIGEPVWDGLSSAAITEWTRYESIINVELALSPLTLMCPYDARSLPGEIVASARRTHQELYEGPHASPNPEFMDARTLSRALDEAPLEEPQGPVAEHPVTRDLASVRRFALEQAHGAGVSPKRLVDALLAVQEVADNVITHGPGHGVVRSWKQNGELVYEVCDEGPGLTDPLVGHLTLDPALRGARGLWLARLLCDLVEVRSLAGGGVVVRVHIALE